MKSAISAILLVLMSLPAIAATEEARVAEAAVEPLGTFYIICVGLAFAGMLVGFYWYYMRWDKEEDKPDSK